MGQEAGLEGSFLGKVRRVDMDDWEVDGQCLVDSGGQVQIRHDMVTGLTFTGASSWNHLIP